MKKEELREEHRKKAYKKKLKETVKKLKAEGETLMKELGARFVGASASRPSLPAGETVGEFFPPPTTVVDASAQPNASDVIAPIDDIEIEFVVGDSRA